MNAPSSRLRRFLHGVASSYVSQLAGVVYGLVSVPVALHYLEPREFGLWALLTQLVGYLLLIDLGVSSSLARLLIDYKDQPNSGEYGSLIQVGGLVLVVQGLILAVVGALASPLFARLLNIPPDLALSFVSLLRWQCVLLAVDLGTRVFSQILYAHQRSDISNYVMSARLLVALAVLWVGLRHGAGLFSIVWANMAGLVIGVLAPMMFCWRLRFFPNRGAWGRCTWRKFKEVFMFGKDLFLLAVGTQLMLASQTIIITRTLGLNAAAQWAIGTKAFTLVSQLLYKVFDFSVPVLAEMLVRGEWERLRDRFRSIVMLTASMAGVAAVLLALCNGPFVMVWTAGKIRWPMENDLLLSVWLLALAVGHCHTSFVMVGKEIRFMRYLYFLEGAMFVILASFLARGGLMLVIAASIVCNITMSTLYGLWRSCRDLRFSFYQVSLEWQMPMGRMLIILLPFAAAVWWVLRFESAMPRLLVEAFVVGSVGALCFLRYGLSRHIADEILQRVAGRRQRMLRFLLAGR
jgi:O-antigen/teichoic acid export membrane protein